jgi:hypothetical protein
MANSLPEVFGSLLFTLHTGAGPWKFPAQGNSERLRTVCGDGCPTEEVAMRGHGVFVVVMLLGTLAMTTPAAADGGAYLEFDKTYYVAGDHAVAIAYVLIPKNQAAILDLGPFYAYALPPSARLREGRAIPGGAVSLGMVTLGSRGKNTQLDLGFTMPALPPGDYSVEICNNPCTISGFREPLEGFFTIVETRREARLIVRGYRFRTRIAGLKRRLKKVERTEVPLSHFESLRTERDALAAQVQDLLGEATARAAAERPAGPLIGGWGAFAICASLLLAAVLVRRRRRAPVVGEVVQPPDAPADHEVLEPAGIR